MAIEFGKGIALAGGFDLGAKAPLDSRLTVATIEERDAHVEGNRAYDGMLVFVEADKVTYQYIIDTDGNGEWKEFGFNETDFIAHIANDLVTDDEAKALSAAQGVVLKGLIDDEAARAAEKEDDIQANIDSLSEMVGVIPDTSEATTLIGYVNEKAQEVLDAATGGSSESAASVKLQLDNYIAENNAKVNANTEAIDAIEEDYLKKADKEELEAKIQENADAIGVLNGDENTDGSVDKKVKDAINAFATEISENGTLDTFKELVDYVAEHGGEAAEMASAIDILEGLVGEKSVATQIEEAIAAENLDQYATDGELADAVARIEAVEGKAHEHENEEVLAGITAEKVVAWDEAESNAKSYVDEKIGAEVTARNEAIATAKNEATAYADTEVAKDRARLDAIENEETGILKQAKDYADAKIGDVDLSGIAANAEKIAELEGAVANKAEASDLEAANGKIEALEDEVVKIGAVEDGKTVVQMLEEVRSAASAQSGEVLEAAKTYADEKDAEALQSAKDYADEKDAEVLEAAKADATEKANAVKAIIGEVEENKTVMQMLAEAREADLTAAKAYTDEKVAEVNTAVTTLSETHNTDKAALVAVDEALDARIIALESVEHVEITSEQIDALFA